MNKQTFKQDSQECIITIWFYFLFLNQTIVVVGTQKNHLNEMVLLSTQNKCLNILSYQGLRFAIVSRWEKQITLISIGALRVNFCFV